MKECQRCHRSFECKVEDIANCACAQVSISRETQDFLTNTEYDCLCKVCLKEIDDLIEKSKKHSFPQAGQALKEGLHYYLENGLWVFTEFYHLSRGYCCQSGCRHCAYGFKKTKK